MLPSRTFREKFIDFLTNDDEFLANDDEAEEELVVSNEQSSRLTGILIVLTCF